MTRYGFAALAEVMQMTEPAAARALGLSGSTERTYRRDGLTEKVADRLAVKAGLHPFVVWPEMVDDNVAAGSVACEECGGPFLPARRSQRFCRSSCQRKAGNRRYKRRKYATDPVFRAKRLAERRAYYEQFGEYERRRQREYDRKRRAA